MFRQPSSEEDGNSDPIARRRRMALVVATACAVLSTSGLLASTVIKSPEQARAEAGGPSPSTVTAEVQLRILSSTTITRGIVTATNKIEVTPVVVGAGAQVITAVNVTVGQQVQSGAVMLAVSGRPLIALAGAIPAYRDLKPGDSGPDVAQLQEALCLHGHYSTGDRIGYFGAATKSAVRKLYSKIGYDVPDTGGPNGAKDKPALTAAAEAVESARAAVQAIRRRIDAGETADPAEEPLTSQLERAQTKLDRAQAAHNQLIATTGPLMPLAEFVFVPTFPATVSGINGRIGETVKAPLLAIAAGALTVTAKIRPDQASLLRPQMRAMLLNESLGAQITGKIEAIGEPVADAQDPTRIYRPVSIVADEPLPPTWTDKDVRVTITAARTESEVLVVPLSAISAGPDGRTTVTVVDVQGRQSKVEIRAGASGDGFVAVTPISGELRQGDRVIVTAS